MALSELTPRTASTSPLVAGWRYATMARASRAARERRTGRFSPRSRSTYTAESGSETSSIWSSRPLNYQAQRRVIPQESQRLLHVRARKLQDLGGCIDLQGRASSE